MVNEAGGLTGLMGLTRLALRMNALIYFDCWGHKELKNIAYNGFGEPYAVTVGLMDGMDGSPPSDNYDC